MKKLLLIALALLMMSANAYAVMTPAAAGGANIVSNDDNTARDSINTAVRFRPDCRGTTSTNIAPSILNDGNTVATIGSVVIWSTAPGALLGYDVTFVSKYDSPAVAGIVTLKNIASGSDGLIQVWGYSKDVIVADATDTVAANQQLGTTIYVAGSVDLGTCGGTPVATNLIPGNAGYVGMALEDGAGTDNDTVQTFINIQVN